MWIVPCEVCETVGCHWSEHEQDQMHLPLSYAVTPGVGYYLIERG